MNKAEIIRARIEAGLKKKFIKACKKRTPSEVIRELIEGYVSKTNGNKTENK